MKELIFENPLDRKDLLPECIINFFLENQNLAEHIKVTEIDPLFSDNFVFEERYDYPIGQGANSIIFKAKHKPSNIKEGENIEYFGVCIIPANEKVDLNKKVKQYLNAKSVSFANQDLIANELGMEVGSMTGVGLPVNYRIIVDKRLLNVKDIIVGGGVRKAKLLLDGSTFELIPNCEIVEDITLD